MYTNHHETIQTRRVYLVIRFARAFLSCGSIIVMVFRKDYVNKTIRQIAIFDDILGFLSERIDFKKYLIFIICLYGTSLSCVIYVALDEYPSSFLNLLCYYYVRSYQIITTGVVMSIGAVFCAIILEMIIIIEQLLRYVKNSEGWPRINGTKEEVMTAIPKLYECVYKSCIYLNCFISVPMVILYSVDVLVGVVIINMFLIEKIARSLDIIMFLSFLFNLLITSIPLMHIEKRVPKYVKNFLHCYLIFHYYR